MSSLGQLTSCQNVAGFSAWTPRPHFHACHCWSLSGGRIGCLYFALYGITVRRDNGCLFTLLLCCKVARLCQSHDHSFFRWRSVGLCASVKGVISEFSASPRSASHFHSLCVFQHWLCLWVTKVYRLSKQFHLDVSLFERLIHNKADHAVAQVGHLTKMPHKQKPNTLPRANGYSICSEQCSYGSSRDE